MPRPLGDGADRVLALLEHPHDAQAFLVGQHRAEVGVDLEYLGVESGFVVDYRVVCHGVPRTFERGSRNGRDGTTAACLKLIFA